MSLKPKNRLKRRPRPRPAWPRKLTMTRGYGELLLGRALATARLGGRLNGLYYLQHHECWARYYIAARKQLIDEFYRRCEAAGIGLRRVTL